MTPIPFDRPEQAHYIGSPAMATERSCGMSRIVSTRQPCSLGGVDGGRDATGTMMLDQGCMPAFSRRVSEKPPQIEAGDLAARQAHGQLDGGFAIEPAGRWHACDSIPRS
ncbi:hypothetical protein MN608_07053 [Microdochium nivale]|nr:hypothetical protein MN608_07053 [Microdochium nivale]